MSTGQPVVIPSAAAPDAEHRVNAGDTVAYGLTGPALTAGRTYTATFLEGTSGDTREIAVDTSTIGANRILVTITNAVTGRLRVVATTGTGPSADRRTIYTLDIEAV